MKSRIDKTEYSFFIDGFNNKIWYKNDEYHREKDKPAIIYSNGEIAWFKNGEIHRENDKPARIYSDGTMAWYTDGEFIRISRK